MTKLEYLLGKLPEHDRREMLYDYEEHFEIGLENGRSEANLIEELGDPHIIARDLLADYHISKADKDKTASNMARAIIATVSLSFFNLVFIIGPVTAILGTYVALCGVALGLTLLPLVIIGASILGYSHESFSVNFFVSLTAFSLGMLMSIGMIYVGKFFYNLILRYIKFNIKIVKGDKAS